MEYMSSSGTNVATTKDWESAADAGVSQTSMFIDGRLIIGFAPLAQHLTTARVETTENSHANTEPVERSSRFCQ